MLRKLSKTSYNLYVSNEEADHKVEYLSFESQIGDAVMEQID